MDPVPTLAAIGALSQDSYHKGGAYQRSTAASMSKVREKKMWTRRRLKPQEIDFLEAEYVKDPRWDY